MPNTSTSTCNVDSYKCSDSGLLMPFVNEYTWPIAARATIYFIGLLWSFMAVSIVADIFMRAIETITSRTRPVRIHSSTSPTGYIDVEIKVWNDTVANLTLMALGSSAPEILLSVIEVTFNDFKSKDLGPSTIVGSAAFNLLVITAMCIVAVPDAEKRLIKNVKVFAVTSLFSLFAYLWLLVILIGITPDYVDLWEAIVTLLFFPILVVVAYIADKDYCGKPGKDEEAPLGIGFGDKGGLDPAKASKDFVVEVLKKIGKQPNLTEEDEARIVAAYVAKNTSHDKGWYRMNAIRNLTGGPRLVPTTNERQDKILTKLMTGENIGSSVSLFEDYDAGVTAVVEWAASSTAVLEKDGRAKLTLMRHGNINNKVLIRVETIDGTAEANSDYKPFKETIVFRPEETTKQIDIEIIDDNDWEPDEVFFVRLTAESDQQARVGKRSVTQITILNDDDPGVFGFAKPSFVFKESAGRAMIPVERSNGADGRVVVGWKTKDMTAISSRDYIGGKGELEFQHGETTKYIAIDIIDDQNFEKDEHFEIQLTDVVPDGARIGRLKRTVVTIMNDDEFTGVVSRVVNLTNANLDSLKVSTTTWGQQFEEAMNVNGGDVENANIFDYVMHFLTFGFKVIFACIPPPSIWGGWLCFFVSLGAVGVLTAIVGDLAGLFGCLVGLKDTVTAITFVALGTSLPDLFASKQAALQEETADNSIGNVTGSNSVNVFLGLGLSWVIAAVYWTSQGKTFEVPAGSLSFSVTLYTVCAVLALGLLVLRRVVGKFGKAELGGSKIPKILCAVFLVFLWVFYIIMSSLQAYGHIKAF
ncbi:sodium/calcium exchanger 2-like isoform X2 [Haliotis rufescens]|uniref:sodium/calcium exchanger 2-like isoform X2 n=1 Tax=Haliotis rufescens TaxID=6454 RepID=UPI00201F3F8E|nr:sodium/calcium exchanger 2-like isoform X2 [Haliotis rufescens]